MNLSTSNIPCWLSQGDKEIGQALLELDWIWLKDDDPKYWEHEDWEYKISSFRGWQFWATPGETSLLVVRRGAVFGLLLEGREPELDFEGELHKAKAIISQCLAQQDARQPQQLSLFGGIDG